MTTTPPFDAIWASLPMPALLVDGCNRILSANPAAETFLNASSRSLVRHALTDKLAVDVPLVEALARARLNQADVNINDVTVTTSDRAQQNCLIQIAPVQDMEDQLLLLISPRVMAERIGRARSASSAAKSAIGMAEMLA
ncbi:MAG: PAS domain-containing sensor histidine kinase, partial [Rhodobacterales bacterium 17-64-5]